MNTSQVRKATLLLGVASVASSVGTVGVKAGPALQTLNNLTNTAEMSVNNTYGQSFSVDGITSMSTGTSVLTPFGNTASGADFNAGNATLTTGFAGVAFGAAGFKAVTAVVAAAALGINTVPLALDETSLTNLRLQVGSATQTIGASISSTTFGPSTVKATSSFTNQLINDLSAF